MSAKEITMIFLMIFTCGFIASQLVESDLSITVTIPFLSMVVVFIGVIFNRIKHIDDLNISRKKEVSLEYIKYMSEYRSAMVNIINPAIKPDEYHSNLIDATKNMIGAMDKLHVVSNDQVSNQIELKNFEITSLMITMTMKSKELDGDKLELMKWLIAENILSKLNMIRYEIINLINTEIGDGSGTKKLKMAIEKNNKDFNNKLSELLG